MDDVHVAVIGGGPRGLSVIQQLVSQAREYPDRARWLLHVIDPREIGQGSHPADQPDHLLTNTVASQVTMFPDGSGPSFTEWARDVGYRRFGSRFLPSCDEAGAPIDDGDYLPRRLLGEYLTWVFDRIARECPPNIVIQLHRGTATDIGADGEGYAVLIDGGHRLRVDAVVLATGHCVRRPTPRDVAASDFVAESCQLNSRLRYFASPYPIGALQSIPPASTVAVQGFGLTSTDVVTALTLGRGGRFDGTGWLTEYTPSGREPRILLFSRSGRPFAARGVNQKGVLGVHVARHLTKDRVRRIIGTRSDVNFDREIIPLLQLEMAHAHDLATGVSGSPEGEPSLEALAVAGDLLGLTGEGHASCQDMRAWREHFVGVLEADLAEAVRGNLTSPIKAATDVIRDCRAAIRLAVEGTVLHGESHLRFTRHWVPLMNRLSFGPPRVRNFELLALLRAGVVDVGGGPGCAVSSDPRTGRWTLRTVFESGVHVDSADSLVAARLDSFEPENDASPLVRAILDRGLGRPFTNDGLAVGGFDVTATGRLVNRAGGASQSIWALGYPTEGPRFYTHALPRTGQPSSFTADAAACVSDLLRTATTRRDVQHAGH